MLEVEWWGSLRNLSKKESLEAKIGPMEEKDLFGPGPQRFSSIVVKSF